MLPWKPLSSLLPHPPYVRNIFFIFFFFPACGSSSSPSAAAKNLALNPKRCQTGLLFS